VGIIGIFGDEIQGSKKTSSFGFQRSDGFFLVGGEPGTRTNGDLMPYSLSRREKGTLVSIIEYYKVPFNL
jgi:hypothetical protein